jgi:hypothetical protein
MKQGRHTRPVDKVRASRDGHEFHEAWAARRALQLVMPKDELIGIAVEGLAPEDQKSATAATIEVADLVLYYGNRTTFEKAKSVVIVQFKYSIASKSKPFRATDATKTLRKFASAFRSHRRKHGTTSVREKLHFELITNRPVLQALSRAIEGIASGASLKGDPKKQATQVKTACGLTGADLVEFVRKLRVTGLAGNLKNIKQDLSRVLADWSTAPDAMARARLGNMRLLLREKAGSTGEGQNLIRRVDVLDALEVQSPDDLFPCPASFPQVGKIVRREQLPTVIDLIPKLKRPLLIHADGGLGKTVFMQSLAKALSEHHQIILFDCFGGGAYRAPEDGRHLPKRGLIHIINSLAADGLCDPLLPPSEHIEDLIKGFLTRLRQAVMTLRRASKDRQLLLFIDAIDNAAEHARDTGERAFPTLLLESFHRSGLMSGVQLIVSCRPHRRHYFNHVDYDEFELKAFTEKEAAQYVRDRLPKATNTEIQVAYARSTGNPRILEHLVSDRGLLDASELNNRVELDDLLRARIKNALREAENRGYRKAAINTFLAGLSVLPPPVPVQDYADAHDMNVSAVKSFAADLAPLLEQTKHGLMFRDEPTETLVRKSYGTDTGALLALADNLLKKQDASVYAASALPGLLQRLDDSKRLFELAFDERFPATITSTVGKQNVRYMRLKAAVLQAARKIDFNQLVHLLVELSTLAAVNERGRDYLLDNPELVSASQDVDATRRLFETRTNWPGTRYARLAIASVLAGDHNDAYRHAIRAEEWLFHFYRQKKQSAEQGPENLDIAAIALCLIAQHRGHDAARFLCGYKDWYAFEVCKPLFALLARAQATKVLTSEQTERFLIGLRYHIGALAAALSFPEFDHIMRRRLLVELATACKKSKKPLENSHAFHRESEYRLEDGLRKSTAIALSLGMPAEAQTIAAFSPHKRPSLWSLVGHYSNYDAFPFITYTAILAAVDGRALDEKAILPAELVEMSGRIQSGLTGEPFRKALKAELEKQFEAEKGVPNDKRSLRYETKRDAERFIEERLEALLEMVQAFAALLSTANGKADLLFLKLLEVWTRLRKKSSSYTNIRETNLFFNLLGLELLIFSLWSRNDLSTAVVKAFTQKATEDGVTHVHKLAEIATMLSKRTSLQEIAGEVTIKARKLVEHEDDVSQRASLFAQLAKAMLPASGEEAATYFRAGLEQMDAIGSGDYQFTNELLVFAAELKGDDLEEKDFHTLSNVCELNMSSDEEKFPWYAFGRGMSRTSGNRMLAKLARWHDRSKISLDYTLLPYLAAMLDQGKIDPGVALALLRLTDPAELYSCGTEELAKIIERKQYPNAKEVVAELIHQFERNHPGVFMPCTVKTLGEIAARVLGKDSDESIYLSAAAESHAKVSDEGNENRNYHGAADPRVSTSSDDTEEQDRTALKKIIDETNPIDEAAVSRAVDALNGMQHAFKLDHEFLQALRKKVGYPDRAKYIQIVARLTEINIYAKFEELKACKAQWTSSSASLGDAFRVIGIPLIQIHADDFVSHGYLSGSRLKEISDLSDIPMPTLAMEIIGIFAAPDAHLSASVWLGIAAFLCEKAEPNQGHAALKRLLNSNAAKLSSSVVDGPWKEWLYPSGTEAEAAVGLIWLMLGSPAAAERWRAAHSVRCLAKFELWNIIDALVAKLSTTAAHPFQAPEIVFYFLHARLWLLIALARIAIDDPVSVAAYKDVLKRIALDKDMPHVLIQHFAAQTLLTCADKGAFKLSGRDAKILKAINVSPFRRKTVRTHRGDSFYGARPASHPEPADDFDLDYDFDKGVVEHVAGIFDVSRWEVKDCLTAWVRKFDSTIKSMYEHGGRYVSQRNSTRGLDARRHGYGQQLGWNGLFLVAGDLLKKYPVANRPYSNDDTDEWQEWLDNELPTRKDGLWLADGLDRPPIEIQVNLKEKGEKGLALTGTCKKLLALLRISGKAIDDDLVVGGHWSSVDRIKVSVTSALVSPKQAAAMGNKLAKEDAFQAWLPSAEDYEDGQEAYMNKKPGYTPWIVMPTTDARLDDTDPLGAHSVVRRLRFTKNVNAIGSLRANDAYQRAWVNASGTTLARSEAWGHNAKHEDEDGESGERLLCSRDFLRTVITTQKQDLLILIILRRYEKGVGSSESQYWHTTAVIHVKQSLEFYFYQGNINQLHANRI